MAQFSRTWWGQRFIEALEQFTDPARLGRGRSYARGGRILDYKLADGTVTAKVRGSINPYFGVYTEPIYRHFHHYQADHCRRLDKGDSPDCLAGGPGDEAADERDARYH